MEGLHTCRHQLVVLIVWVVQELVQPPEDLAHVILLKDFMHGSLQAHCRMSGCIS